MKQEKPLFVVKQPGRRTLFALMCCCGPILFIIIPFEEKDNPIYTEWNVVFWSVITLLVILGTYFISQTYRIQVYEDRIIKRFLLKERLILSYDEIDSIAFKQTKLGTFCYDINSPKGRISIDHESRNVEEMLGWIDKKKREGKK